MPKRKKKDSPIGWTLFEKYCPKCDLAHSWSYDKCKKCGERLVARKKR